MAHISVLYEEVLTFLQPTPGGRYIDGTLGAGGHTAGLLERSAPDGQVLAFDRDAVAIAQATTQLGDAARRMTAVQGNFAAMGNLAPAHGFSAVDGIVLDLGLSSWQLDDGARGFSFRFDGPLDMRFDTSQGPSAEVLVNSLPEDELAALFWRYGEERHSRRLAALIVANRPLTTTRQLADLIASQGPGSGRRAARIHPATRVFQALRIAVNDELAALAKGLDAAIELLRIGGRVAVISFHSLEDRLVKRRFRDLSRVCVCPPAQPICTCARQPTLRLVTRKVVVPTAEEVARNPRSRSAKLRVAEKAARQG